MIFTSPHPDIPIPKGKTVWNMLELHARERGDKPAFVCGITDKVLTFAELLQKAKALSVGLVARGITKGDVVVLHSFNCIEYPVVSRLLRLIGDGALANMTVEAAYLKDLKPERVFVYGEEEGPATAESLEDLIAQDLPLKLPPMDPMDVVTHAAFSSGTTGRPKGMELTGYAMLAAFAQLAAVEDNLPYYLGVLPFYHILAAILFHATIFKGLVLVDLPSFDLETFLGVVEKYRLEKLTLAPPLVLFLAKHPIVDKFDLSSVKVLASGGAPMGNEVEHAEEKRIGARVL
ncbi:AMP-binding enzyme [Phytophthora cinnamomi]|uniref:AMP-binding enzyme n=1 Tax=Phytophthora cinnamomi TaxID=4785 RepID=UPI0035596EB0|nr:AMP-binding enzyme [Phytophthora cinnamomi]